MRRKKAAEKSLRDTLLVDSIGKNKKTRDRDERMRNERFVLKFILEFVLYFLLIT